MAGMEEFFVIDQKRSSANWPLAKILQRHGESETGFKKKQKSDGFIPSTIAIALIRRRGKDAVIPIEADLLLARPLSTFARTQNASNSDQASCAASSRDGVVVASLTGRLSNMCTGTRLSRCTVWVSATNLKFDEPKWPRAEPK